MKIECQQIGKLLACAALLAAHAGVGAANLTDFQNFIAPYNGKVPPKGPFLRLFTSKDGPDASLASKALDYLAATTAADDAAVGAALSSINGQGSFALAHEGFFKNSVDWNGSDVVALTYRTLYSLTDLMAARLEQLSASPARQAYARYRYAQLLDALLPVYFVKVANIREPVDHIAERLNAVAPDFIVKACKEQQDYPVLLNKDKNRAKPTTAGGFDCYRGFQVRKHRPKTTTATGQWALVLGYNPMAEAVHPALDKEAKEFLDKEFEPVGTSNEQK